MSAIRNPTELTPEVMVEWSLAELGSRIVVTGTGATSFEDLANESESYGVLCAIETVIAMRSDILTVRLARYAFKHEEGSDSNIPVPYYPDAYVMCFRTIREAMATLEYTMPLAWIHLGHGDYEVDESETDDEGHWGDEYAWLSDGEDEGDWIRTEEISGMISKGVGSMLFCILPVCVSSHSGDVLQSNSNILAIHATEFGKPHSAGSQLLEMPGWKAASEASLLGAITIIQSGN